jgi:hypothetical protein
VVKYLALSLLLLTGCPIKKKGDRTPNGWLVSWEEEGTISTGLHTRLELYTLFDAAMERAFPWVATKVGLPESYVRHKIKDNDSIYYLRDDSIFQVDPGSTDAPNAVWASGLTLGRTHTRVAFYEWVSVDPSAVPVTAPVWTIHPNPNHADKTIYGDDQAGNEFPALNYEMHWQFTDIP